MDVEAEIRELKRRVGELEGSFAFLLQQVRAVHADLLEFRQVTESRFDRIESRFDRLEQMLPEIVASAVGEALRSHRS
jgi:hypothetical protein